MCGNPIIRLDDDDRSRIIDFEYDNKFSLEE